MRSKVLRTLYKIAPFDLRGDCIVPPAKDDIRVSCVINFYGRLDLLNGILHSLSQQDYPRERFEVVLVEDRGGTPEGRKFCESFSDRIQVVYSPLDKNYGRMGYSRNFGISLTRGGVVLFLDDDTVILQRDFLSILMTGFEKSPNIDALIPQGNASFTSIKGRYGYHDPYFMTSRCMAYRRSALEELGGFFSDIIGQEDVEFVARFLMANKKADKLPELAYYHPPLLVQSLGKPKAVGFSFSKLIKRYPLPLFVLMMLNCCRHLPLVILPGKVNRMKGRFGFGFLLGCGQALLNVSEGSYRD